MKPDNQSKSDHSGWYVKLAYSSRPEPMYKGPFQGAEAENAAALLARKIAIEDEQTLEWYDISWYPDHPERAKPGVVVWIGRIGGARLGIPANVAASYGLKTGHVVSVGTAEEIARVIKRAGQSDCRVGRAPGRLT